MHPPRWRLTVRRMMLAIALFALLFAAIGLKMRRDDYLELADYHRSQMSEFWIGYTMALAIGNRTSAHWAAARRAYHETLWRHYTRAASQPWRPVGREPPPP